VHHFYFTTEFVGVGPYRLARWERGAHIEFARFADYYRGVPPFSKVVLRFIEDANAMVAAMLAEEMDVSLHREVGPEAALELRERWAGTGHQVIFSVADRIEFLLPQLRPEFAEPRDALVQRPVRQALSHAINREELRQVVTHGIAPAADSWIPPGQAQRRELEAAIPQFPYDPRRATAMLAESGWARGPDEVLVHRGSGERFEVHLISTPAADVERKLAIVADSWKGVGVRAKIEILSPGRYEDSEYRAKLPGVDYRARGADGFTESYLHSRLIASPANRWSGNNGNGYNNPVVDTLIDRQAVTIEPSQRLALERQLLTEVIGDVAITPLLWRVDVYLARKGVKGLLGSPVLEATWNMYEWDKD
jgi:peptide/nickel transport system substrate-binding protein